jgi:hypothetical protein
MLDHSGRTGYQSLDDGSALEPGSFREHQANRDTLRFTQFKPVRNAIPIGFRISVGNAFAFAFLQAER